MQLRYDEDFVEAAVFLCATGRRQGIPSLQIARFHRDREKLYLILDPEERNTAFFKLHLEFFREWGLEQLLMEPLAAFPLLPQALQVLAFRKSRRKQEDGTELYVTEAGARTGVVAMSPERLARAAGLAAFLHHEMMHLQDMVDPTFGYAPELVIPGNSLGQQRLARERYRLLWDVSIDGRLTRAQRPTVATREQRWQEFSVGFSFWSEARQQAAFEALWTGTAPSHQQLEAWVCDPRQLRSAEGPRPGALCPLCGFPTFSWADRARLSDAVVSAIQSEFPVWEPGQGACSRCGEVYRVKSACGHRAVPA